MNGGEGGVGGGVVMEGAPKRKETKGLLTSRVSVLCNLRCWDFSSREFFDVKRRWRVIYYSSHSPLPVPPQKKVREG